MVKYIFLVLVVSLSGCAVHQQSVVSVAHQRSSAVAAKAFKKLLDKPNVTSAYVRRVNRISFIVHDTLGGSPNLVLGMVQGLDDSTQENVLLFFRRFEVLKNPSLTDSTRLVYDSNEKAVDSYSVYRYLDSEEIGKGTIIFPEHWIPIRITFQQDASYNLLILLINLPAFNLPLCAQVPLSGYEIIVKDPEFYEHEGMVELSKLRFNELFTECSN